MHILHLSKYYHPYRGGIEKVIKELSEAAVREGHQVTVVCANESSVRSEEIINGVQVIRLPTFGNVFSQPLTPSVFWELGSLFRQVDVVHLHTPNPLFEFACLQFKIPCPLVVTYHCDVLKAPALNSLYQPIANRILKRADRILVATEQHLAYSKWLKPFTNKCEIIPFGIEPRYHVKTATISHRLNQIQNRHGRYFLFVGRMVWYKGVPVLLEAMKSNDKNLVLIGKGPLLDSLRKASAAEGLSSRVHFLGAVENDDDFAAYLHGCDALVLPSITSAEAFGLVLLEAMSCGKPVITTALDSGVRSVNRDGETGLMVPPGDWSALSQAMSQIADDDKLRERLGVGAGRHFQRQFLASECFKRHYDVYSGDDKTPVPKTA